MQYQRSLPDVLSKLQEDGHPHLTRFLPDCHQHPTENDNTVIKNMYSVHLCSFIKHKLLCLENASLILTHGFLELANLCIITCICRKFDIPVRTRKWPPCLNFTGACYHQKTGALTKTIVTRHVMQQFYIKIDKFSMYICNVNISGNIEEMELSTFSLIWLSQFSFLVFIHSLIHM